MLKKRPWQLGLIALGVLVILAFASYMISNTALQVSGSSLSDGELAVETNLPSATCRKVFGRDFPWVKIRCEELEDAVSSSETTDNEPRVDQSKTP